MNRLERAARAWAAAGLENDFIFSKVMSDPAICLVWPSSRVSCPT